MRKFCLAALLLMSPMVGFGAGVYGIVSGGYAWSMKAGIDNPDPSFWDGSDQGYDARLGNAPFFTIGVGANFCDFFSLDVGYSFYQTFYYQKYQTGGGGTPGFSGTARTRFFDLDHQNLLFNLSLIPNCFSYPCCGFSLTPILGAGIGVGINHISNFHTVAFAPDPAFVGTTTTIGDPHTHTSFAWQATLGLEFRPVSCPSLSIDIGYHYYNGGCFQGPSRVMVNSEDVEGGFLEGAPWQGKLKANEVFLTLNYYW